MNRRRWEIAAGALALVSGASHAGLGPSHFSEWWGYGLFFVVAATAEAILGLALVLDPFDEKVAGARLPGLRRTLYAAGLAGNVLLIGFYVVTRTLGIPLGPQAGDVEALGPLDVATKIAEAGVVLCMIALLRRGVTSASR